MAGIVGDLAGAVQVPWAALKLDWPFSSPRDNTAASHRAKTQLCPQGYDLPGYT
jgi:hypothetical protein